MPKSFTDCVEGGGRVRRKTLSGSRYLNLCFNRSGSHAGEVHKKKSGTQSKPKPKRYGDSPR